LPPTCPHSFTLCPHCAALAPRPTENACGAITTGFDFYSFLSRPVAARASFPLDIRTTDQPTTTAFAIPSASPSVTLFDSASPTLTCAQRGSVFVSKDGSVLVSGEAFRTDGGTCTTNLRTVPAWSGCYVIARARPLPSIASSLSMTSICATICPSRNPMGASRSRSPRWS